MSENQLQLIPDPPPRPEAEVAVQADAIVAEAWARWRPVKTFALFSGGDDSLVLLHMALARGWAPDGAVHVNTGTGVPETTEFVRDICAAWGVELHELRPPRSFEEVFIENPVIDGLPGPGAHQVAYARLKERALRRFSTDSKSHWRDKVMLLTGIRKDESARRMGYDGTVVDRDRCRVWVNPLYYATGAEMRVYRAAHSLPRNPVSANLHVSGECLCGCFARPGELEQIRFFYPEVAARIEGWERRATELGLTHCRWGAERPGGVSAGRGGRLCQKCDAQMELLEAAP